MYINYLLFKSMRGYSILLSRSIENLTSFIYIYIKYVTILLYCHKSVAIQYLFTYTVCNNHQEAIKFIVYLVSARVKDYAQNPYLKIFKYNIL